MYEVHGQQGVDPTEAPRGPYPFPPVPHSRVVGEIVERLKAQGLHPSPLPLGLRENCIFCNTCNSFPCKIHAKSDADVCGVRPATQSANVTLWTNAIARKLITDPSGRKIEAVEIERDGKAETSVGAARDRVVRRGELGGAAAAIGHQQASGWPGEFIRPRRQALHGAPGDDDAGLSPVPEERHGVPEDRGDQRLLSQGTEHAVSARPDPVAGPHPRRDGADGGAAGAGVGLRHVGVAGRGLAGDDRGSAAPRQQGHRSSATAASGCTTGRTTSPRIARWSAKRRRSCASSGSGWW